MQESEKEEIIRRTADEVMRRLQEDKQSPRQVDKAQAESILRRYPELSHSALPSERRAAAQVDAFLTAYAQDPYIEAVRLFYLQGLTNAATARHIHCDDTTCRRNRSRLVRAFANYIASAK